MASVAQARTVAATAGGAIGGGQASCFSTNLGFPPNGVQNTCPVPAVYQIPLVIDNFFTLRNVSVSGQASAGGAMTCQVVTFTPTGAQFMLTPPQSWNPGAPFQTRTFTNVNVPSGGTGFVFCQMSGNATSRVLVINYTPN
jgi:hypothetical protein